MPTPNVCFVMTGAKRLECSNCEPELIALHGGIFGQIPAFVINILIAEGEARHRPGFEIKEELGRLVMLIGSEGLILNNPTWATLNQYIAISMTNPCYI